MVTALKFEDSILRVYLALTLHWVLENILQKIAAIKYSFIAQYFAGFSQANH